MPFLRGKEKSGGRQKGTSNHSTKELRLKFSLLLENNLDRIQEDIDSLEPKDRVKTLLELTKFVIPTLRSTELKSVGKGDFKPVIIQLGKGIPPPDENLKLKSNDV
jgi:hypothetical protein